MPLNLHSHAQPSADSAQPQDRREELLREIGGWIGRVGVVNFSLRAAAKAVGVTAPTLLRHFGSKEGLLKDLAEMHGRNDIQSIRAAVAEAGSLRAAFESAATKSVLVTPEYVRLLLQLAALQNSETLKHEHKSKALSFTRVFAQMMVKEGVEAREAMSIAHYMQSSSSGFLSSYAVFQDLAQLQENYRRLYATVAGWMKQSARVTRRAA